MVKLLLPLLAMLSSSITQAQNTFRGIIKDSLSKEPLTGVSVIIRSKNSGNTSNHSGEIVIHNVPNGEQTITISHVGYKSKELMLFFPLADTSVIEILLSSEAEALEEVVVQST